MSQIKMQYVLNILIASNYLITILLFETQIDLTFLLSKLLLKIY